MDRVFWSDGTRIKAGQLPDGDAWAAARDRMESARLGFINAARQSTGRFLMPVTDLPVARPPLSELIRLSQPDPDDAAPVATSSEVSSGPT